MKPSSQLTALGLTVLLLVLASVWIISSRTTRKGSATTTHLVYELCAELPFYYRWVDERLGTPYRFPQWLISKADHAEFSTNQRRGRAEGQLAKMGTNAWPVVPLLVKALEHKNPSVGVAAGSVLVAIRANEHPDWSSQEKRLRGRSRSAQVFRSFLSGRNEFSKRYDVAHRRFGLLGLAAVGPTASKAIPDVIEALKSKEDYQLWAPAMVALKNIGGQVTNVVQFQKAVSQDAEEGLDVRASAVKALAAAAPDYPEARNLLRHALEDEKSLVRLAAARELWRLNTLAGEVLPTLTALLSHKLVTTRTGALGVISEMGSAALPIRSDVARLTSDDNETVRQAATAALKGIGVQSNVESNSANMALERTAAALFRFRAVLRAGTTALSADIKPCGCRSVFCWASTRV